MLGAFSLIKSWKILLSNLALLPIARILLLLQSAKIMFPALLTSSPNG